MTKLPDDLPELVGRLHRALTAEMLAELRRQGFDDVTPAFASILPFIDSDGSRQSDIAHRAGSTKQAIGQLVKELAARGYVAVERDGSDRRATRVTFTDRGKSLRTCGFRIKIEQRGRLADHLGAKRSRALQMSLEALLAYLEQARTDL